MTSTCEQCGLELPEEHRSCPVCVARGDTVGADDDLRTRAWTPTPASSSTADLDPGTPIAGRYRIMARLGRGGMGVVYRAWDRELGQDVALKLVDGALARDPRATAIVREEVRLARRVTHPNVCRVHDLGEVDGRPFVSMEYVDGEDLASLLRRIGRLSGDKALDVARQLCAGLHAAHERGVLHRDLKPANVMLDGAGKVRITDFGLAAAEETLRDGEASSGTPAYMAPELFTGGRPSVRSDVFALGLVLYELWTGQPLFRARSMTELLRHHRRPIPSPSRLAPDLEPEVEHVILACLQQDPERRPASALAVLAALPGGDPLALAIASGETPSPELIAQAGDVGALRPIVAVLWMAALAMILTAVVLSEPAVKVFGRTPLPYSVEVLADRARTMLTTLGWPERRTPHRAYGIQFDPTALRGDSTPAAAWDARLAEGEVSPLRFFYREAPQPLRPANVKGRVLPLDPPLIAPGTVLVELRRDGVLRALRAVPAATDLEGDPEVGAEPDDGALLAAAGLSAADLQRTAPTMLPPAFATTRRAWNGHRGDGRAFTVDAAWCGARPVLLEIHDGGPAAFDTVSVAPTWRLPARVLLVLVAASLAWHALRRRRADVGGALRLGGAVLVGVAAFTALGTSVSSLADLALLWSKGLSHGLAVATEFAVYYLALEPWVRRLWPESLISWSRLLQGRTGNPLVGRHALIGVVVGAAMVLLADLRLLVPRLLGAAEPPPTLLHPAAVESLYGTAGALSALLEIAVDSARQAVMFFFALVLTRVITRNRTAACVLSVAIWSTVWSREPLQPSFPWVSSGWLISAIIAVPVTVTALRCGLLPLVVGFVTFGILASFPLTLTGTIHTESAVLALGVVTVTATLGMRAAVRVA